MNYVIASYLNLLCYLLLGASHYLGYTSLMHVALLAALVSFYFTVKMLRFYRRHQSEAPQGMPTTASYRTCGERASAPCPASGRSAALVRRKRAPCPEEATAFSGDIPTPPERARAAKRQIAWRISDK